jgi:hypothetical protein
VNDEALRQTSTHAVAETDGRVLGLELKRMIGVLFALVAGLLPGWFIATVVSLPLAACVVFGPALVVLVVQFALLQGKPPGWFLNWLDTRLTGGHLSPLHRH